MTGEPQVPGLVIFDCDGVLVESEAIFNRVLHEFLTANGAQLSYLECCTLFVGKNRYAVERYLTELDIAMPDNWSDRFYAQVFAALEQEVTPISGVKSVLQALRQNKVPFCVASNGLIAKMKLTLGRTGLLPLFKDNMFSAYDIGQGKPAPDVFLFAAKANGIAPEYCVVVEDSPSGLEAAANAGMACYAYVPSRDEAPGELFGATGFADMCELPKLLGLTLDQS